MRRQVSAMFARARELRRDSTAAEARLWELLRNRRCGGLRFLRQVPAAHFVLDFYCPASRLVIEVDGGIHDCPATKAYDEERQMLLEAELHLTFLRLSNADILCGDDERLTERIRAAAYMAAISTAGIDARPARLQ